MLDLDVDEEVTEQEVVDFFNKKYPEVNSGRVSAMFKLANTNNNHSLSRVEF